MCRKTKIGALALLLIYGMLFSACAVQMIKTENTKQKNSKKSERTNQGILIEVETATKTATEPPIETMEGSPLVLSSSEFIRKMENAEYTVIEDTGSGRKDRNILE